MLSNCQGLLGKGIMWDDIKSKQLVKTRAKAPPQTTPTVVVATASDSIVNSDTICKSPVSKPTTTTPNPALISAPVITPNHDSSRSNAAAIQTLPARQSKKLSITTVKTTQPASPLLAPYIKQRGRFGMDEKRILCSITDSAPVATDIENTSLISLDAFASDVELYQYLNAAKNVQDFLQRITQLLNSIGVTDFAHTSTKSMSGVLDPFGTYDPKTTDQYAKEGFHTDDMTVRALLRDKRPIFRAVVDNYVASAPFDTEVLARHREARKFLQKQGMLDVYNVPIIHNNEVGSLFSMSTHGCDPQDFQARITPHAGKIQFLARAVDTIGTQKFNTHFHNEKFNPRLRLHLKPLLLLETLAQKGCTLNEAAEVLDIAISTANQHIAAAKKAFGVSTTQGAIIAALKEKLIHLE
jgi:hypothetical protein